MSLVKPSVIDGITVRKLGTGDVLTAAETATTLTTVGAGTITGAKLAFGILTRSGPTADFTDTTCTAAELIAAVSSGVGNNGMDNGTTWRVKYQNTVGFTCTLAGGTNVTLSGNTAIPPLSVRDFLVRIDNGTATSVVTGTTTSSSKVITGMTAAQTAAISVGMAISGTGIPASTKVASVQQGVGVTTDTNSTATATLVALTFAPRVTVTALSQDVGLPDFKYVATTANTSTLVAGDITGAKEVTLNCSGQATPTLTTRTADLMIADMPNAQIGMTWKVKVLNRNSGTQTMAGGTGVTITGTATLATVTWKEFICTYTAASTIVMQVGASALI